MRKNSFLFAFAAMFFITAAHAATIEPPLTNPQQETLAHTIFLELRCVVCEGQSIADSDAVLAAQMRAEVRHQIESGKTREEVLAYFRERYGDRILMTPPINERTSLLWLAPLMILIGGAYLVRRATRSPKEAS